MIANVLAPKVSIIGCGNVGMRYAYSMMIKGIARQLVLIDADRRRLEGEVLDLAHASAFLEPVDVMAGEYSDTKDSDLVVITAGKKQLPGQTRIDLAKDNVALYKSIIPQVMRYSPNAIFLIVTNPVDVLAYAAYKISAKPASSVIGSGTVLDTARFRYLIAKHCRIDARNVHAYILGEHGDSEFAVWSSAQIGAVPFSKYCYICGVKEACQHQEELSAIFTEVKTSAYQIIERKQETSYGIGLSLSRISEAILNDENAVLPVSSLADSFLQIKDVYVSYPAVVNKTGIREVLPLELCATEKEQLLQSASLIRKTIVESGL